ncbi:hypothetical protein ES319_A02G065100v1 [Gossypium barbadense]|uniref:[2Fe-2S]-binding domain-containing protein n=3 Tax=Gossypium TaxID=3633 RepID=A0A5J5WP03_GOSBA|nr:xanthine dehydrogenase 1 isoform X2 [Gossypium hirsutum]KAB2092949.1 hypothetical protein ES319_A02G065100v1 [Gossypium barbadense]TYH27479.1 hypothetical protein ES288_A02G073000v1 [Gossypium darwinii]KAB2092956.1 hypothetical protein ES319_A02G065100v1 [Gossypium barbadense]KAB2092960.1 hypothetical protein ES319_A02G065100v1 [Gossypium barbadense]TYH27480.1 hypothetical protein ES288_A02G073000v1 [Gossypium darwinii]
MISHYDRKTKKCMHYAVNACLAPLYSVEGMHVITVEGVGNHKCGLHPIQESLARSHGSQCGFCTPGFIMSLYALLRSSETPPTEEQIEESLAGNLCRCTGYRPIVVLMSILLSIFLPWTRPFEYVKEFNQAHRRDDDIAIVNAGMCVCLQEKSEEWVISDASVAYGGVAPLSLCAIKTRLRKQFISQPKWNA